MHLFLSLLVALTILPPLLAGLAGRSLPEGRAGTLCQAAAVVSLVAALACVATVAMHGAQTVRWSPFGEDAAAGLAFRVDAVSSLVALMVAFLGTVVMRFSVTALVGAGGERGFLSWLSLTLGSVATLVLSSHLLLLLAAWISTSLCLHRLLLHYPSRSGAVFAARKKFVFSRLGDACLLGAALLLWANFGTFDVDHLVERCAGAPASLIEPAAFLVVLCASLKSAQFPFHSWLPDTLETPTPVSAFMHAGIVNAGGYLVIRLARIVSHAPHASATLAVIGSATAAFGAVVMLAQPSIKRALAYSTVAQMGFMMLQCGLGAYGAAVLHILSHSLYKAHAFLTSGSTVGAVPRAAVPLRSGAIAIGTVTGAGIAALYFVMMRRVAGVTGASWYVLASVLALALTYGISRAVAASSGFRSWVRAALSALALASLALVLGAAAERLTGQIAGTRANEAVLAVAGLCFLGLFTFQVLLWRTPGTRAGRALYVHSLNGFYIGTAFNRILGWLWPIKPEAA